MKAVAGFAFVACASSAMAADAVSIAAGDLSRPQVEVSTATLPRFDRIDGAARASRLDVTLLPQTRSAVGLAVGITSVSGLNPALGPGIVGVPAVDLGVHWRYTFDSNYRFDVTAYRRVPNSDAISLIESHDPGYGARVELGLGSIQAKGRSKGFVADRGFLGFQLESGARLTIKRSGGKPMLYYRNSF
jgi:hypothetical protein